MKETQVWSLGGEDPLEEEMAPHSSILAWKVPQTEEHTVHGVTKSRTWLSNYAWTLAWFSGFPLLLTRCKYWPDVLLSLCEPQFPCLHSGEDMACLSGLLWYLSKITYACVTHRRSSVHSLPPHPFTSVHTNVFLCTCESAVIHIFKITQHELCDMRDRLSPREEA